MLKEVFFINIGKKIARAVGYTVSGILLLLCILLMVCSFGFGSGGTVKSFGFNVYIAESDEFDSVPLGSAVFAKRCNPYDLEEGNLVLYSDENGDTMLGYTDDIRMVDGEYVISVSDSDSVSEFKGSALIGRAEMSSAFWGAVIRFSLTPVGVLVMAVLPCLIIVIIDIVRSIVSRLPPPEVIPQYKTTEQPEPVSGLSVKPDGNASYNRSANQKPPTSADNVLFSYTAKQKPAAKPSEIIPLTDRPAYPERTQSERTQSERTQSERIQSERTQSERIQFERTQSDRTERAAEKRREEPKKPDLSVSKTPASVAARRYMDSAAQGESRVSGDTAELPELPKKAKPDAFFTQSEAPQIGRQKPSQRAVIDLEDALSGAAKRHSQQYSGKRSSAILAGKNPADLISDDDDDSSDSSRYAVDDILAGLENRKK